jgi:hypothetical protein
LEAERFGLVRVRGERTKQGLGFLPPIRLIRKIRNQRSPNSLGQAGSKPFATVVLCTLIFIPSAEGRLSLFKPQPLATNPTATSPLATSWQKPANRFLALFLQPGECCDFTCVSFTRAAVSFTPGGLKGLFDALGALV